VAQTPGSLSHRTTLFRTRLLRLLPSLTLQALRLARLWLLRLSGLVSAIIIARFSRTSKMALSHLIHSFLVSDFKRSDTGCNLLVSLMIIVLGGCVGRLLKHSHEERNFLGIVWVNKTLLDGSVESRAMTFRRIVVLEHDALAGLGLRLGLWLGLGLCCFACGGKAAGNRLAALVLLELGALLAGGFGYENAARAGELALGLFNGGSALGCAYDLVLAMNDGLLRISQFVRAGGIRLMYK
jgi:hypothetical protein